MSFEIFVATIVVIGGIWGILSLFGDFGEYKRCSHCRYNGLTSYMVSIYSSEKKRFGFRHKIRYYHIDCIAAVSASDREKN